MTVEEEVKKVIAEELCMDVKNVWLYAHIKSLGGDSLNLVNVTVELEDRYGIQFPRNLSNFVTVHDVVKYVEENANIKFIKPTEDVR